MTGNIGAPSWFSRHEDQSSTRFILCADNGTRCGRGAGAADISHTAGPDRATGAVAHRRKLRAAAAFASWCRGSGRNHHRAEQPAAGRQARQIRRGVVPAGRGRSRNARADPARRQHAGDSTARQPRRRPIGEAEIASVCNKLLPRPGLLDRRACHSLYAARSHPRLTGRRWRAHGGVAQLVRARES